MTGADVRISLAAPGDETDARCAEILADALASMEMPEKETVLRRACRLTSFSALGRTRLLAFRGERIVGFLDYLEQEIKFLMVAPDHHRRGVGTALVRDALARIPDEAWVLSITSNTGAERFYASCGFAVAGHRRGRFFGVPMENVVMTRPARGGP